MPLNRGIITLDLSICSAARQPAGFPAAPLTQPRPHRQPSPAHFVPSLPRERGQPGGRSPSGSIGSASQEGDQGGPVKLQSAGHWVAVHSLAQKDPQDLQHQAHPRAGVHIAWDGAPQRRLQRSPSRAWCPASTGSTSLAVCQGAWGPKTVKKTHRLLFPPPCPVNLLKK